MTTETPVSDERRLGRIEGALDGIQANIRDNVATKADIAQLESQTAQLNGRIDYQSTQMAQMSGQMDAQAAQITETATHVAQLEVQMAQMSGQTESQATQIAKTATHVAQLEVQMAQMNGQMETQTAQMNERMDAQSTQITQMQEQMAQMNERMDAQATHTAQLEVQMTQLSGQIAAHLAKHLGKMEVHMAQTEARMLRWQIGMWITTILMLLGVAGLILNG